MINRAYEPAVGRIHVRGRTHGNQRGRSWHIAQSEKAKAGLLMAAQLLEIYNGLPDHERHGAERFLRPLHRR
ncbi:MAG: hypothetical protein MZV70_00060 [Desulfobacterales bacterium]|nr:hypothetical protein [Desulfobacterales bacterium]